ncbi:MAG: GHKL domain-containing protein [Bacteroidia bacterium]|nr:GHKL domain-containing protein [Bacteroidia bacterium]
MSILVILHLAYTYYKVLAENIALVSIGLISFVAVAQFAPAIIGGIYWKQANKQSALWGILLGFGIWFYTLVLPSFVAAGMMPSSFIEEGLLGWELLKPYALFGLHSLDSISHALFWSLLFNISAYVSFAYLYHQNTKDAHQAEIFVNIYQYYEAEGGSPGWKGIANIQDLKLLLMDFLGKARTEKALKEFSSQYGEKWQRNPQADSHLIAYTERLLAGTIGVAAARIVVASVVKEEEEIRIEKVYDILRESQQLISLNKELKEKSLALEQATQQLRVANRHLQQADHQKNEFISTITHEMRTPVTSIRALSEILYDNDDLNLEEKRNFLNTIIKETNRMERLISQVLDLEKFESGKQKLNFSYVSINEVVREALDSVYQLIQDKHIQLRQQLDETLPPIPADRDRLTQVLLNLLSNAIKFCHKDQGIIIVSSYLGDNLVGISVQDNGKGIRKELHELIFEKFYQAEDQNIRKPKGSGLGLAICKKIVQHHQGQIWVESEENQFTKFTFTLPVVLEEIPSH